MNLYESCKKQPCRGDCSHTCTLKLYVVIMLECLYRLRQIGRCFIVDEISCSRESVLRNYKARRSSQAGELLCKQRIAGVPSKALTGRNERLIKKEVVES